MDSLWNKQKLIAQDRSVEWLCSWMMLAWAVTFSLPGDTLSLPAFKAFRSIPEWMWLMGFTVVGSLRMAALYVNGRWPRSALIRRTAASAGAVFWAAIAVLIYLARTPGSPWGPTIPICIVLAGFELLSVRRAAFDARYYSQR